MFKSIIAASLLVSGAFCTQYGDYAAYSQVTEVVTHVAPTSCTQGSEAVETAPPAYAVESPATYTASAIHGGSSTPMIHKVVVGGDAGLVYTPEVIYAAVGDIVEFHFMKQNHSVTQSTFAKPCVRKPDGIDSGLMPNINNTVVPAPIFKYTVDTTEATWWYCKQRTGTHCGKGMTFAINPTKEKTFDQFKSMAIAQNGTATSAPTAAPTYAPPSGASSTVTLVAGSPSGTETAPSGVATWVDGNGNGGAGACQCQCFCGVAAYPSGYGINNYGGMPGALPAPWATSSTATAAAVTSAPAGAYYRR
ncbi:hypothetical protein ABW19_dt0206277 [Dactylella cylindrospora]|nr:hypothetical protein ABW19_dt0206277 [Dactylella cylindrospora]